MNPTFISSIGFGFSASIVKAVGSTLYVGRRTSQHPALFVVDASDPANMQIVSENSSLTTPNEFQLVGSLLFVADGWVGLLIMDVSDSKDPVLLSQMRTATNAQAVLVEGDYAYLAETYDQSGLQVFNVSNPRAPYLAGYYPCPLPCALELINDHLLVGTYNEDLQVAPLECDYSSIPHAGGIAADTFRSVSFGQIRTRSHYRAFVDVRSWTHPLVGTRCSGAADRGALRRTAAGW